MFDIAIVGVGATGVSLLKQIQDQVIASNLERPRIALICPKNDFAKGRAFGNADLMHKVNTPPSMLSVAESEPLAFDQWMSKKGQLHDLYPNRILYSEFLQETYNDIKFSEQLSIIEFHSLVENVYRISNGYKIVSPEFEITAKQVVLCLGSLHGSNFPDLLNQQGFHTDFTSFQSIPEGDIIVAGTGLTAVDALRSLSTNPNRVMHLFSRHGLPPTCLSSQNLYTPTKLKWSNLKNQIPPIPIASFFELLNSECLNVGCALEKPAAEYILQNEGLSNYFRYLLNRAKNSDLPYQDMLVSTRPYMHKLWRSLSIKDRLSFNNEHGASWSAWRHPVPQAVIENMSVLAKEGRLHIHKVTKRPCFSNGNYIIESNSGLVIKSTHFIDATGGTNRLLDINSSLIKNLISQNLIEPNICGGLTINPLTFELQVAGRSIKNLFNIGPLNKGSLFSTNAFWFNSKCAGHWARQWAIEKTNLIEA